MSAFLSGATAECGPSNVLKNVQGRVDRDYSLQQDLLVATPNVAGSSKQPFRPQVPLVAPNRNGAQTPSPFDLASLRQHLSPPPPATTTHRHASPGPSHAASGRSAWASAFANQAAHAPTSTAQVGPSRPAQQILSQPASNGWSQEFAQHSTSPSQPAQHATFGPVGPAPWQIPFQPNHPLQLFPSYPPAMQQSPFHVPPVSQNHAPQIVTDQQQESVQQSAPTAAPEPLKANQDLLARTAETFIVQAEERGGLFEQNPKLAQSSFMSLVRSIGGQEVVVDEGALDTTEAVGTGGKLVERTAGSNWTKDFFASRSTQPATTPARAEFESQSSTATGHHQAFEGMQPQYSGIAHPLEPYQHTARVTSTLPRQDMKQEQARWESEFADQEALVRSSEKLGSSSQSKNVHFDQSPDEQYVGRSGVPNTLEEALATTTAIPGAGSSWAEQGFDEDDFNDEVFMGFNGFMRQGESSDAGVGKQQGWGEMQDDWERFVRSDVGQKGIRGMGLGDRIERYLFQRRNLYYAAESSVAQADDIVAMDSPTLKGVLELEAAVQEAPQSHDAWYALGLKQQENEREEAAILALSKVVQLEPDYRPAYLALAVSYTNEGEGEAACTMLEKWIRLGEAITSSDSQNAGVADVEQGRMWGQAGKEELIERLIEVARKSPEEVDADVQVALGVLFNGTEEYLKAEDCFLSALEVRPNDWLLHNRLGATLANSGRSNEAIQYYHKALSLHPNFVRALFNLGISYINLGQYLLGAQSALDALRIQHADASEGYAFGENVSGSKGVTSDALWNTLKGACVHMNRHDLVQMVERRDLSGFPMSFVEGTQVQA
ncbi:hypothetical protein IAU59_002043 [Kwoniella sp. CBS 9459]